MSYIGDRQKERSRLIENKQQWDEFCCIAVKTPYRFPVVAWHCSVDYGFGGTGDQTYFEYVPLQLVDKPAEARAWVNGFLKGLWRTAD
jgi:hypothetical protein